ncbi:uncharacterized protein LOC131649924 [Vicia villosa]|uniref:uncharacterized protein LOC131649924 n=1 Tax=Vicia villosa TaxID=3911 RepID=UPI00273BC424|nr:uncharacterized protein LOC131649924 [Vicia villosa]
MEEENSLKIALEVLVGFSEGDKDTARGGREDWRVDENKDRVSEGQALKKRKNNEEKESPSENPICPKCKKEFPTWETTIGHMQENPNCTSIGSSSALGSSYSRTTTNLRQFDLNKVNDDDQPMEIEGTSNVALESAEEKVHERKDLGFDLNQLPPSEEDDVM